MHRPKAVVSSRIGGGVHDTELWKLSRVVIDDCHLAVTADDYRPSFAALPRLRATVAVPFVFLTATLPPKLVEPLKSMFGLECSLAVVRASTARPNISYRVDPEALEGGALDERVKVLVDTHRTGGALTGGGKAIVFCTFQAACARLAAMLGCKAYHSDLSREEQAAVLNEWAEGESDVVMATSGLGAGIDVPSVRLVIHRGLPWTLIDFAQESGRAGRDGRPAVSHVVPDKWRGGRMEKEREDVEAFRQASASSSSAHRRAHRQG